MVYKFVSRTCPIPCGEYGSRAEAPIEPCSSHFLKQRFLFFVISIDPIKTHTNR